jgi:hypothetical protein
MKYDQIMQIPGQSDTQQVDTRNEARSTKPKRNAMGFVFCLLVPCALAVTSCIGPVALHQAVSKVKCCC